MKLSHYLPYVHPIAVQIHTHNQTYLLLVVDFLKKKVPNQGFKMTRSPLQQRMVRNRQVAIRSAIGATYAMYAMICWWIMCDFSMNCLQAEILRKRYFMDYEMRRKNMIDMVYDDDVTSPKMRSPSIDGILQSSKSNFPATAQMPGPTTCMAYGHCKMVFSLIPFPRHPPHPITFFHVLVPP
ncbi:hypothetical protein LXL04_018136 [Taraxacum kok-saghyz]